MLLALILSLLTLGVLAGEPSPPPVDDAGSPPAGTPRFPTEPTDALRQAQLTALDAHYTAQLALHPTDSDILAALATIAERQGRASLAQGYRQQAALSAQARSAELRVLLPSGPRTKGHNSLESELREKLLAATAAGLHHFALANELARQGRWSEAEAAYFRAVEADKDNPDFLFNLAVSLDHLGQYRQAIDFYRLAHAAGASRPAGFDSAGLLRRLSSLLRKTGDEP